MEKDKWGRRIRAFRKLKGITQQSLAKKIGISVSIMGEIERGNRQPTPQIINRIAEALGISVDELAPPEES